MGCHKLAYYQFCTALKIAYRQRKTNKKTVQGFIAPDPAAEKYYSHSPYSYVKNNPMIYIDPDGKKRIKASTSFSMNTGFLGIYAKVLGVGIEWVQTLGGGAKTEISVYMTYDTEQKRFGIGVSHTKTDYESSKNVTVVYIYGNESKEKSEKIDANTTDGFSYKKDETYTTKEGAGIIGKDIVKDVNVSTDGKKTQISTGASLNLGIFGVEVKRTLSVEPEPKQQPEQQQQIDKNK